MYRFESLKDKTEVLHVGPYTYHNKPFVLKPWTTNFMFDKVAITTIPLWPNLLGLPVGYQSIEYLSKVASAIGKPLYTDKNTIDMNRISYGRVLVEIDISRPLTEAIEIKTLYGIIHQKEDYDWIPKFCNKCT